ncbi:MAG: DUF4129 domain-containing protein [Actinobacteria bacterium]|nr:MAG: DUF4129 domain-containing protein [Actinomycetota bacterium]
MRIVASSALVIREAHAAWDEFLDTLIDFGIPLDEAQTPRETVGRITRSLYLGGEPVQALALLARVEERARYARTPLDAGSLDGPLRVVRAAVAARASRRTRLRAALLPPSVLQRWRYQLVTGGAELIGSFGRTWDTVVRLLSPRRLLPGRPSR